MSYSSRIFISVFTYCAVSIMCVSQSMAQETEAICNRPKLLSNNEVTLVIGEFKNLSKEKSSESFDAPSSYISKYLEASLPALLGRCNAIVSKVLISSDLKANRRENQQFKVSDIVIEVSGDFYVTNERLRIKSRLGMLSGDGISNDKPAKLIAIREVAVPANEFSRSADLLAANIALSLVQFFDAPGFRSQLKVEVGCFRNQELLSKSMFKSRDKNSFGSLVSEKLSLRMSQIAQIIYDKNSCIAGSQKSPPAHDISITGSFNGNSDRVSVTPKISIRSLDLTFDLASSSRSIYTSGVGASDSWNLLLDDIVETLIVFLNGSVSSSGSLRYIEVYNAFGQKIEDSQPFSIDDEILKGEILSQSVIDRELGESILMRALSKILDSPEGYSDERVSKIRGLLGNINERRGNVDRALRYYRKAISTTSPSRDAFINLSRLLMNTHDYSASQEVLQSAMRTYPDDRDIKESLARVYMFTANYELAVPKFRELYESEVSEPRKWELIEALNGKANIDFGIKYDCVGAIAAFQEAITLGDARPGTTLNLAELYIMTGQLQKAKARLDGIEFGSKRQSTSQNEQVAIKFVWRVLMATTTALLGQGVREEPLLDKDDLLKLPQTFWEFSVLHDFLSDKNGPELKDVKETLQRIVAKQHPRKDSSTRGRGYHCETPNKM